MTDELEVLEPSGSSVTYRGEVLDIKPLTIGALPKLVRTARPVIDAILALDNLPAEDSPEMAGLVMDLIENHSEQVFVAAAICIGKPAEWVEGGGIDEFVTLAKKVFEVNHDFFVLRLGPLLADRAAKPEKSTGPGPTASSS